jgi:radical SAM protein with 4Fe4S-binding SPASM domain
VPTGTRPIAISGVTPAAMNEMLPADPPPGAQVTAEVPRHGALDNPRAINDVLALLDSTWLLARTKARPTHYDVAVSKVCNIKCPFCPRQTFPAEEIKSGLMREEHFAPVVPHLETSHRTGLYGLGEPFLNPRFFDFLAAAKERGSYCMTSSHGMSLTPEMIERVLDSGLDELCVSMDGASPRTFNFLRSGADFHTVVHNVTALLRRRNERGQKTPRVHIACAISKYNVWELKAMVRLAHRLGADQLAFSNLVLDHPEHAHASVAGTWVFRFNMNRAVREAKRLGLDQVYFYQMPFPYKEEAPPEPRPGVRHGCPSAWRQLIIERDGNIKPCCYLDVSLGNTKEGTMEGHFNSEAGVALRQSFVDGNYYSKCKNCGQFLEITDERTREILDEAAVLIREGAFSEETRRMLAEAHAEFVAAARERGIVAAEVGATR